MSNHTTDFKVSTAGSKAPKKHTQSETLSADSTSLSAALSAAQSEAFSAAQSEALSAALLSWYDWYGRDLPWRVRGAHSNPYMVWVSEIMLQQTTVKTVIPYFHRFMEKFPDIQTLAKADIKDVLLLWQGLGYYTRARKLHECACYLVDNSGGEFPKTYSELLKLPGIGPYTAASISSLAFDLPEAVVDGNVIRVISRLYGIRKSTVESLPEVKEKAQKLMHKTRAADYTSAIMDLGATVCVPQKPNCGACPFSQSCVALKEGLIDEIPLTEKFQKTGKCGKLFWIENENGDVYIQKRTEKGLLHGLTEFPWSAVVGGRSRLNDISFPVKGEWQSFGSSIRHVFTHIDLELHLFKIRLSKEGEADFLAHKTNESGLFVPKDKFSTFPFSTLMKKIIKEEAKQQE